LSANTIVASVQNGVNITNSSLGQIEENMIDHNSANGIALNNNADDNSLINNQILNNGFAGVSITQSVGNTLQGNLIEANGDAGISLSGATGTVILANTIHDNADAGIFLADSPSLNNQNTITENSLYANDGLGIDLAPTGVNANDAGDGDDGPNTRLNFPENLSVTGDDVSGTACSGCTVEVFWVQLDLSGYGEGKTFVGSGVASGGNFTITTSGMPLYGWITTTATDPSGNTSEFSPNLQVGNNPFQPGIFIVGIFIAGVGIIIVWVAIKNRKGLLPWQKGALLFFGFLLGGAVGVGTALGVESLRPVRSAPPIPTNTPTTALGPAPALPTDTPSEVEQPPTATASASPSPTATPTLTPSATPSPTYTALPSNTPTTTAKPPTEEPSKPPKPPKSTPTSTPKPKKVTPTKPSG
jgi:parallel beta-helix repeat protein